MAWPTRRRDRSTGRAGRAWICAQAVVGVWMFALTLSIDLDSLRLPWPPTHPAGAPLADIVSPIHHSPLARFARRSTALADDDHDKAEKARKEAEKAAKRAREEAKKAAERARKAAEKARKEARKAAERARKAAERARKEARKRAERARKEARKRAERAREQARKRAEKARKEARERAERARKRARERAEKASKAARHRRKTDHARKKRRSARKRDSERDKGRRGESSRKDKRVARREAKDDEREKTDDSSRLAGTKDDDGTDDRTDSQAEDRTEDEKDGPRTTRPAEDNDWSEPPTTLVGFVERLIGESDDGEKDRDTDEHADKPAELEDAASDLQTMDSRQRQPQPRPRRTARQRPSASVGLPAPRPPAFRSSEVIAMGLGPRELNQAMRLGFAVRRSTVLSHLGVRATRLRIPRGMNVLTARQMLQDRFPRHRVGLNRLYHIYKAADGAPASRRTGMPPDEDATLGGHGRRKGAVRCSPKRCFGPSLIRWKRTLRSCGAGLRIGIIDTGVDNSHPVFQGRGPHVADFIPPGRRKAPRWHGTSVLSILAGDPKSALPGLLPNAEYFAANVFYLDSKGRVETDTYNILRALDLMKAFRVQVVNMSFTGPPDPLVAKELKRMSAEGTIFVAAAGNDGPSAGRTYPAGYDVVVSVTAVDRKMRVYRYANRDSAFIDVAAPGVRIWAAEPGGRYAYRSGTSFATPYVTAILAAAWGHGVPNATPKRLLRGLEIRKLGRSDIYGRGLLLAPRQCGAANRLVRR